MRAAIVQLEHRPTVAAALRAGSDAALAAARAGADLILLPEYWFMGFGEGPVGSERADAVRAALRDASADAGAAVAGNVIERAEGALRNVLAVYDSGRLVAEQPKIHPMPREAEMGIVGGDDLAPFDLRGASVGGIVCADVFYPEAARVLSIRGAEILLNPVMSPHREEDPTGPARESVYVARAWDSGAFVLKAGGVHRGTPKVHGRSLATAPWGTLAKARSDWTEETLLVDLDLAKVRGFRETHRGFQARAPKAYRTLFED